MAVWSLNCRSLRQIGPADKVNRGTNEFLNHTTLHLYAFEKNLTCKFYFEVQFMSEIPLYVYSFLNFSSCWTLIRDSRLFRILQKNLIYYNPCKSMFLVFTYSICSDGDVMNKLRQKACRPFVDNLTAILIL